MSEETENEQARQAWEANAAVWDARLGEDGNRFTRELVWPSIERLLLPLLPEQRIVEIACGTGVISRRLARAGAQVLATDFSPELIARALARETYDRIEYRVCDATREQQLRALASSRDRLFDAAVCSMALFDIADIEPLCGALPYLLKDGAPFVFTVMHPCFNNTGMAFVQEQEDQDGTPVTRHSIKVWEYRTARTRPMLGMSGAQPHPLFHRSLTDLFGALFAAGFVVDKLDEPTFAAESSYPSALHWDGRYSEFPPVLGARARFLASSS